MSGPPSATWLLVALVAALGWRLVAPGPVDAPPSAIRPASAGSEAADATIAEAVTSGAAIPHEVVSGAVVSGAVVSGAVVSGAIVSGAATNAPSPLRPDPSVTARPLFAEDRRAGPVPAAPQRSTAPTRSPPPPRLALQGVIAGTDRPRALIAAPGAAPAWTSLGADIAGWTLAEISADGAVLIRGDARIELPKPALR